MAKEFKKDLNKKDKLNLSVAENAFYDALCNNKSAEELMSDDILIKISKEIADKLRNNITVDLVSKRVSKSKIKIISKKKFIKKI